MTTSHPSETFDRILWLAAVLLVVFGAVRTGQAGIAVGFEVAGVMGPERLDRPPPPAHPAETAEQAAMQERQREWHREMNRRTARRSVTRAARGLAQSSLWLVGGLVLLRVARRRLRRYEIPP